MFRVIGLDPTTPDTIRVLPEPSKIELYSMYLIARLGLSRFMPEEDLEKNFPILATEALTEREKQEYEAVFYRSFLTGPMLFFISKDQDNEIEGWKNMLTDYLSTIESSEYVELNTGHYLHHEKAEVMAERMKAYISALTLDR